MRTVIIVVMAALCACGQSTRVDKTGNSAVEAREMQLASQADSVGVLVAAAADIDAILERPFELRGCDNMATATRLAYEELKLGVLLHEAAHMIIPGSNEHEGDKVRPHKNAPYSYVEWDANGRSECVN